jgi:hypothetical protein
MIIERTWFADLVSGLGHEESLAVANDIWLYGNAFVETVDGKKRRLPPSEWPETVRAPNNVNK